MACVAGVGGRWERVEGVRVEESGQGQEGYTEKVFQGSYLQKGTEEGKAHSVFE